MRFVVCDGAEILRVVSLFCADPLAVAQAQLAGGGTHVLQVPPDAGEIDDVRLEVDLAAMTLVRKAGVIDEVQHDGLRLEGLSAREPDTEPAAPISEKGTVP